MQLVRVIKLQSFVINVVPFVNRLLLMMGYGHFGTRGPIHQCCVRKKFVVRLS